MARVLAAAALAAALAAAAAAGLSSAATQTRVACGGSKLDFYFWPAGHPAIPQYNFPAYSPPHMEIYKGGSVADSAQVGYVGVGQGAFAKACKSVRDTVTKWGGGPYKTAAASGRVSCAFRQKVELKAIPGSGGSEQLIVTLGHTPKTALYASVAATGSRLNYDTRFCRFAAIKTA